MARVASLQPVPWRARRLELGEWRVTALSDGWMRLDGGSMWGVVPAPLWRAWTPPDEDNAILLALRPFLLERGDARVVIEPGVGGRWGEKEKRIYGLDRHPSLEETLAACGVDPGDVTHVVATHCHWDHIGAQVIEEGGELRPRFPRARHFAPAIEVERARDPGHARAASYRWSDVEPIAEAGLLETFSGRLEILPGLVVHELGGHSDGVSVVTVDAGERTAVFWSDVVPTTHHVQPPYIMAYDLDVARSYEVRSDWLRRAADGGWIGLFYHDADEAFGRIVRVGHRFAYEPLETFPPGVQIAPRNRSDLTGL